MTIPDRLEQVLTELEALHCYTPRPEDPPYCPECSSVINNTLIDWPCRYAFLFAKLRAAKSLQERVHSDICGSRCVTECAAWQQAGESDVPNEEV